MNDNTTPIPMTLGQRVLYGFALWLGVYIILANIWQVFELVVLALLALVAVWYLGDDALKGRVKGADASPVRSWLSQAWKLMRGFPSALYAFIKHVLAVANRVDDEAPVAVDPSPAAPAPVDPAPATSPKTTKRAKTTTPAPAQSHAQPDSEATNPWTQPAPDARGTRVGYHADGSPYVY